MIPNSRFKVFILISILLVIISASCKNELDINAEYEDINVVYCIMNPSIQRQYIRINRAFLTEGNALVAATEPDSSNYPYKLKVTVSEYNSNGQLVRRYGDINFLLDTVYLPTNTGSAFNTGAQVYYYFDAMTIHSINTYNEISFDTIYFNPENSFRLKIENPVTGEVSQSETNLIDNFTISKPITKNIAFVSMNSTAIEMKSPKNGKLFDAKFIFYYREVDITNPADTVLKEIEWKLGTIKTERITGGENVYFQYVPYTFFNLLKQRIPEDDNLKRLHGKFTSHGRVDVQLIVTAGTLELSTYIDANKPSGSIIQERPVYTNITNGIGLFSSKRTVRLNFVLNAFTVDSLRNGSVRYLNFQ